MKLISAAMLFLWNASLLFAQHTNFNTQRNWSLNKKEFFLGFGATQFTGDLGGRNRIGTDFSLVDIDFPATSFGGVIGFRYRFHPYFATSSTLNIGMLKGNDALTNEVVRNSRNLQFRTMIYEYSQRLEFILFANEKFGARYRIPGRNAAKNRNERVYLFTGAGICYFNPEAQYNGSWVKLDPLNTEGQGLPGGAIETLPISMTIPFGIGLRMGIGQMLRIGIEASYVKTFSDYIDDVSTTYYDPSLLGSEAAAYLSNPAASNVVWFAPGQQRGDKNKDAYYYLNVVAAYNITYKSSLKKRRSYQWNRARYKF
jgi:hypothetical protein